MYAIEELEGLLERPEDMSEAVSQCVNLIESGFHYCDLKTECRFQDCLTTLAERGDCKIYDALFPGFDGYVPVKCRWKREGLMHKCRGIGCWLEGYDHFGCRLQGSSKGCKLCKAANSESSPGYHMLYGVRYSERERTAPFCSCFPEYRSKERRK